MVVLEGDIYCTLVERFLQDLNKNHDLVDAASVHYEETPPTRTPSTKRIDHILFSSRLAPYMKSAHCHPLKYILNTNHITLTIDIETVKTFAPPPKPAHHKFKAPLWQEKGISPELQGVGSGYARETTNKGNM